MEHTVEVAARVEAKNREAQELAEQADKARVDEIMARPSQEWHRLAVGAIDAVDNYKGRLTDNEWATKQYAQATAYAGLATFAAMRERGEISLGLEQPRE